jgi:hypothetical protein
LGEPDLLNCQCVILRWALRRAPLGFLLGCFLSAPLSAPLEAYSVLSHEALIDAAWDPVIVPLLLRRFPNVGPAELRAAHAFAYGGCVIQDLGYYPLGNHFFSNLTHYARSGHFVLALINQSRTAAEYAFALGALSHYIADNLGHPLAVNLSVPDMYPSLRREYGNRVTYEDNPRAHIMTEFSFDVVQITGAGYLPRTYHNFIGFQVPKGLLERAFQQTYGLRFHNIFFWEGISLDLYRVSASEIVPALGGDLWKHDRDRLKRLDPQLVTPRFKYRLAPRSYQRPSSTRRRLIRPWTWHWRQTVQRANISLVSRFLVTLIEILPKVGPLATLRFKPPTLQVQDLFINSFDDVVSHYESDLSDLRDAQVTLPETNLDTGEPRVAGRYKLADETYAQWLLTLEKHQFRGLSPEVRHDILTFYGNSEAPVATKRKPKRWAKVLSGLESLRAAGLSPAPPAR